MKQFKVALVEAGSPSTHVYSRTYLPRVGIPTMGAVLKSQGHDCDLWFQSISKVSAEHLRNYDIVGIGSLSANIQEAYRLADSLRQSDAVVVMGGPHPTFMPEEALAHCDYVVIGEGDVIFPALVAALEKGENPAALPGLAYRLPDGEIYFSGAGEVVDYEHLPSPDFSMSPQLNAGNIPPIITTSRGCPHNCVFCSVTAVYGRKYRLKSSEQVIAELRSVQGRSVCFGDDNFCANPARTKALLREMMAQNAVPLRWSGEMCVKAAADEELLDLMQRTHCRIMYVGVESVSRKTLKEFGKNHEVEDIGRCIRNLHDRDIGMHGMFVLGVDDDVDSVKEIADYAIENDIDTIQICALTPFPGTAAYEKYGSILLHRDWKYFDGMHVVFEPQRCSAYDLQMAIAHQMSRFYSLGRVIGSYRRGRGWRIKYRLGGHYLMRKWIKENRGYFEALRTSRYRSAG